MAQHTSEHSHGAGDGGHHETPSTSRYLIVFVLLLIFTVLTYVTAKMDLGRANLIIALAIATTKATLVVLFFMHLVDHGTACRLVFGVSTLFLVVLILGVLADVKTRFPAALPHGETVRPEHMMRPHHSEAPVKRPAFRVVSVEPTR